MARNSVYAFSAALAALIASVGLTGCGSKGSPVCLSGCSPPPASEVMYGIPQSVLLNAAFYAPMNPETGAFLGQGTSLPLSAMPAIGMVGVNGQFLYVATGIGPNPLGSIVGFSLDPTTGALTLIPQSPFVVGSSFANIRGMATPPNSLLLYVSDVGGIDGLTVNSTNGVLTPVPGSPFPSGTNVQLVADPSGKFLYASDPDSPGGVLAFTIGTNGALTPVPGSPFPFPGQTGAGSEPVGIVDDGSLVYVALSGTNQVAAYSINSSTGALTSISGSPFAAGSGPSGLTFANRFLYATDANDGSISGFSIDSTTGALSAIPGSPFNACGGDLANDASGKYLYNVCWGTVYYMSIDSNSGALANAGSIAPGFLEPYLITVVGFPRAGQLDSPAQIRMPGLADGSQSSAINLDQTY